MVYVTDCPRKSCTVFGYGEHGQTNCIIFRYLPRRTIGRPDECYWSVTLSPGTAYPEYLYNTYERRYRKGAAVLLTSTLKARLLSAVNERRVQQNRQIIGDHLPVVTRPVAYEYAASLVKDAHHSILAVDFMSPRLWTRPGGFIAGYIDAHPANSVKKVSIHGFNEDRLAVDSKAYLEFIALHRRIGCELRFIEKSIAHRKGLTRGFIIVDSEMLFMAEDLEILDNNECLTLEDVDNALALLKSGCFQWRPEEVRAYKKLFDELLLIDGKNLLTDDMFESRIKALQTPLT